MEAKQAASRLEQMFKANEEQKKGIMKKQKVETINSIEHSPPHQQTYNYNESRQS